MGCGVSKTPVPMIGNASAFYWACRNGDIQTVRQMLPTMSTDEISRLEPNGSTALHAACYFNRVEMVRLLLQSGCDRTVLNRHGLSAYREAQTEEIRRLFLRPDSDQFRFMDQDVGGLFTLVSARSGEGDSGKIPNNFVRGYSSIEGTTDAQLVAAAYKSKLKFVVQGKTEMDSSEKLKLIIEKCVWSINHPEAKRVKELFTKFWNPSKNRANVDHLITMYTMETPFYGALRDDNAAFTSMMYLHLDEYRERAFKGRSYRGAAMTDDDIAAHRWALQNPGSIIETCTVQSMSSRQEIAEDFATRYASPIKHKVLVVFDFPEICPTAIALSQISDKIKGLSQFDYEAEILLLPFTLFEVQDIKVNAQGKWYHIFLKNVPVPEKSLFSAWRNS